MATKAEGPAGLDVASLEMARGLRYLLRDAGFEERPWFWYAEAITYSRNPKWWPLLGRFSRQWKLGSWRLDARGWFDIAASKKWPPFYEALLEEVEAQNLKSFLSILKEQLRTHGATRPTVRFLPSDINVLFDRRKSRLKSLEGMLPGFLVYGEDTKRDVTEYCKRVLDRNWGRLSGVRYGTPFPKPAVLVSVPLIGELGGHPLLLGIVILFLGADVLEHPIDASAQTFATELFRGVNYFALAAQDYLRTRHGDELVGELPSREAHHAVSFPAVCDRRYLATLRMADPELHDKPWLFRWGQVGSRLGDYHTLRKDASLAVSTFLRTTDSVSRRFSGDKFRKRLRSGTENFCPIELAAIPLGRSLNEPFENLTASGGYQEIASSVHRWLKALYSFDEPSDSSCDYELFPEHLVWLSSLMFEALGAPAEKHDLFAFCHDGSERRVRVMPTLGCAGRARRERGDGGSGFWLPVKPGVRFMAPLLQLASHIGREFPETKCDVLRANGKLPDGEEPSVGFVFRMGPANGNDSRRLQGWREVLSAAVRPAKGLDTALLWNVRSARLGPSVRGLLVRELFESGLFDVETKRITGAVDVEARTLSFTWRRD